MLLLFWALSLFTYFLVLSSHRTLLPLTYPPHTLALGSIYVASLLLSFEQPSSPEREGETSASELANLLNQHIDWETKFHSKAEDLDGAFTGIFHFFRTRPSCIVQILLIHSLTSSSNSRNPRRLPVHHHPHHPRLHPTFPLVTDKLHNSNSLPITRTTQTSSFDLRLP